MDAQMCKIVSNRQTNHEKKRSRKLAHGLEMTKQGQTQALQSLIFEYPPTQNRSFNFSTFVENVFQMASKDIRNWGPWVPLAQKVGRREVYKTRQKTSIRKVIKSVKNVLKKGTPKSGFLGVFRGLEPKASQGGPKDPPEDFQTQIWSTFVQKRIAELYFCDVLLGLVPDWTHVPRCFRSASRCSRTLPEFSSV